MFNVSKRGTASLLRFAQQSSAFAPVLRTPTFSLAQATAARPAILSRYLHISSPARSINASARFSDEEYEPEELQVGVPLPEGEIITKFQHLADKGHVHHAIIAEITQGMGHHTMTEVQSLTIDESLRGTDIIAQARTGTGKTLGFLIPVMSRILKASPELATPSRYSRATPSDIRSIIISPTRELAEQIAVEAKKITRGTGLKTQIAVGGSNKRGMLRQMQQEGCHILVATPGRLNDLLTDPYSRVSAPKLQTLVLDEADRLLDAGFSRDIQTIIDLLPAREEVDRQTLLFSATVPREVMSLVRSTLKPDYQFVQTVKLGEPATHEKIPQRVVQCKGYENIMPAILELAKREIKKADAGEGPPFKALVYINSTAGVSLAGEIFRKLGGSGRFGPSNPVYPAEIFFMHGKLSQEARTRVSQNFRNSKSAIMFSSDVTARGMDFPNVTHVIQCGVAPNRDQYVHRIGRTGRGDKTGEAWTFLTPVEMEHARRTLRGFPISVDKSLEAATIDMTKDAQLPAALAETLTQVGEATKRVPMEIKEDAFAASFGPLIQAVTDKRALIGALNNWTRYGWGLEQPMSVSMGMARKLHIENVPGVIIGSRPPRRDDDFGGRDNGGFGGRSNSFGGDRDGGRGGFGGRSNYGGDRRGGSSFEDRDGGRSSFGGDRARGRSSFGGDRRGGSNNRGSFQRRAPEPQASF